MIVTFRIRRDIAANWTAANPILALGEPGLETDTRRVKYGNGSSAWVDLPYSSALAAWADISGKPAIITSLVALNTLGLIAQTSAGAVSARSIAGTANQITVLNGDGTSGNPTLSIPSTLMIANVNYAGSLSYVSTRGDAVERFRFGHYDAGSLPFPTGQVAAQILASVVSLEIATRDIASATINFRVGSGVTTKASLSSTAFNLTSGVVYQIAGVQVVSTRKTGWTAATGTADRSTFATYTEPTISSPPAQSEVQALAAHVQILSRHLKALTDDLISHGLIGA